MPYALLSALVVTFVLGFASSTEAARRDAAASAAAVLPPGLGEPADTTFDGYIAIGTSPSPACSQQPVSIRFSACRCNVQLVSADFAPDGVPRVRAIVRPGLLCIQCDRHSLTVPIGLLAAGHHTILIERNLTFVYPDSSIDSTTARDYFNFDVQQDCLPPTGIQYLHTVLPGRPSPCVTCPPEACPNDSIPLYMNGLFPNPCIRLKEVRLLASPVAGPMPVPPLVEVVYAADRCTTVACPTVVTPWETRLFLPPLPPNPPGATYQLLVRGVLEDDCGVFPPEPMGEGAFAFVVVESCSTAANPCFVATFQHGDGRCDATYGGPKPAETILQVQTRVAMAGLQGELYLDSPALMISNLETIGATQGMTLQWTREGFGARFVMFAEHGAPIFDPSRVFPPNPVPVLKVSVEPNPLVDAPIPPIALLTGRNLLGSDEQGEGVFPCPQPATEIYPHEPYAWLCLATPCDHNEDGQADVRDLVLLTRCVQGEGACPSPITGMDCDHDGGLDLDDVLCCARVVLGLPPPDSLTGRPEPAVTVALEPAVKNDDGTIDVAVHMGGTDVIGASRLELRYPWMRYELVDVVEPTNSRWLPVSQDQSGVIALGLIAIQPKITTDIGSEQWIVRLRLREGQSPGGSVSLTSAQFSGVDGVGLTTNVVPHGVPLGPEATLALAAPRPNPFVGETTFSIQLDDPSDLEVGVFDLAGRRVATLFKGLAPAGANEYRWRGITDQGERAPSGVYFVRAWSGSKVASRKVLFVSANVRYLLN